MPHVAGLPAGASRARSSTVLSALVASAMLPPQVFVSHILRPGGHAFRHLDMAAPPEVALTARGRSPPKAGAGRGIRCRTRRYGVHALLVEAVRTGVWRLLFSSTAVAVGSTLALKTGVWRRRAKYKIGKIVSDPDFNLNVLPPSLPKRPANGGGGDEVTRKAWRKIIYWARWHDRAMYGTTNRYVGGECLASERVVVLGGGAFGTAMASHVAGKGVAVTIVMRDAAVSDFINRKNINPKYLSQYDLPRTLRASTDAAEALAGCTTLILAIPVQASRKVLAAMAGWIPRGIPIIAVSKGIEMSSGLLMCNLIPDALGRDPAANPVVVVSGPSFAKEIMDKRPTCVVAASPDSAAAQQVQKVLMAPYFRVSITDDVIGVEVAGALKNVLAIAAGICEGLGLGMNAMSALVMQGNAEIRWLATAMGARPETLAGLSGMGDILLTCFGSLSRNRGVGVRLGQGQALDSILRSSGGVAEGVYTSRLVVELADKYKVLLPVMTMVARVLNNEVSPRQAVFEVMALPPLPESA